MMVVPNQAQVSSLVSDQFPVGMSDEEELRRFGETQGVGETLVDYDSDIDFLGLRQS